MHAFRHLLLFALVLCGTSACGQEPSVPKPAPKAAKPPHKEIIRPPAVAGAFYPGTPEALRNMVNALLSAAPATNVPGTVVAAIAPHAGYAFSGKIAALTHRAIANTPFDTVVIIGHNAYRGAVAYLCPVDAFETPLGTVPTDREMMRKMMAYNPGIVANTAIHRSEHTVEVQLPFFQVLGRKNYKIVPILFGDPSPKNCKILADAILKAAGGKKVFVLASTDMSHYPPYREAEKLDHATLKAIETFDIQAFFKHLHAAERKPVPNLATPMCASGGVGTAMLFAKAGGATTVRTLGYANAGDAPGIGDKRRVVGYGAALFLKP